MHRSGLRGRTLSWVLVGGTVREVLGWADDHLDHEMLGSTMGVLSRI